MAFTEVQIANLALSRIGIARTISALTDSDQEAVTCNLWYAPLRDEVLTAYPWPFTQKYVTLGLVEEDPNDDWAYSYRYPSDCLIARRIVTGNRNEAVQPPFTVAHDSTGLLIYTDESDAVLLYTATFTDAARFSATFASALAWRLAAEIASPLAQRDDYRERAMREYHWAISVAAASALNEEKRDAVPDAEWVRARE